MSERLQTRIERLRRAIVAAAETAEVLEVVEVVVADRTEMQELDAAGFSDTERVFCSPASIGRIVVTRMTAREWLQQHDKPAAIPAMPKSEGELATIPAI